MAVEVLHGRDAGVAGVPVVEVVQSLALLPVPEAMGGKKQNKTITINI